MPEKCAFYKYDRGYYCIKAKRNLDRGLVDKYCWGYHYGDCPIYKDESSSSSGGCYITTACVEHKKLADNCEIMMNLRAFRDDFLTKNHKEDIEEYYKVAPAIVRNVNSQKNSSEIWDTVYEEMIKPCNDYITKEENKKAYALYKEKALELKEKYTK